MQGVRYMFGKAAYDDQLKLGSMCKSLEDVVCLVLMVISLNS